MHKILLFFALFSLVACESRPQTAEDSQAANEASEAVPASQEANEDPLLRRHHDGRVVAIADVHGDVDALVKALQAASIIDEDRKWSAGTTLLVQTGDVLDRGVTERNAYELLFDLREQAQASGGDVILLIGNHEMMNAIGDLRYVVPEAMDDFDDAVSDEDLAALTAAPQEVRGRFAAWRPGGPWAKKVAVQGIAVIVNDTLFVHGGVEPEYASSLDELNRNTRSWMRGQGAIPRALTSQNGPLWSRAFSNETPDCKALEKTLGTLDVERMVVGHTVQKDVTAACDSKVWRIDAGMSSHYGGTPHALEIRADEVVAIGADSH